jgi:C-terminal processing protease CtpA/Prc
VVAPIDDTPAAKAGVMANDIITKLDDEQVHGLTAISTSISDVGGKTEVAQPRDEVRF